MFALSFLIVLPGCKETLDPLEEASTGVYSYGTVDAHFCTSIPAPAQQKLKYLFIMDHSASNKPIATLDTSDVQNTDPDGARRYGPMINFVNTLSVDANTTPYYAMIDFNDTASQPAGLNGFSSDTAAFVAAATTDWIGTGTALLPSPVDSVFTNYQDALNLAYQLIQEDAESEAAVQNNSSVVTSIYQIIFVTDGAPVIETNSTTLYTQVFSTDIQPVITTILALKTDPIVGPYISNISLNTAYYFLLGSPNAGAVTLLGQMAATGNGLFEQFATGQQILYQAFAPANRAIVNDLADVFVENENGVWWDNGQFMLDTDGDGLPDAIEAQLGSNPNLKDSDGNGVSDLVEYRTKGTVCNSPNCAQAGRDAYSMCAGYSPTTDANNNVTFQSSANDGLNDCEKFLLNASTQSFNGNGDLIPDLLAFKNTLSIQTADGAVALADPFGDGITNYNKLKMGLPIQISKKQVPSSYQTRITSLTVDSVDNTGVTCYHYVVNGIALSGPTNTMKVYVVQNSSMIQNKTVLMTAEKSLGSGLISSFAATDFK